MYGIYVLAGGSKCLVVIADWLVCIADVSGLVFVGDVFLAVAFSFLVFLFLFFCSTGFQMASYLNDTPLMWCLFSSGMFDQKITEINFPGISPGNKRLKT